MDKFCNQSLTRKNLKWMFLGGITATLFFLAMFFAGNSLLESYFSTSNFIYKAQTPYIQELSEYVKKNHISATDSYHLSEWVYKKGVKRFTVSRERILLYDNAYSDTTLGGQTRTALLHYNYQYFHTISFSDGNADVYIYADYERNYYLLFWFLDLLLSIMIWIFLFGLVLQREVKYIQELNQCVQQIGSGELFLETPIKGTDELGQLASGIERMRLDFIEKNKRETQMKSAQDNLVLGMAHDLRTPLTVLMAFLEIAKKHSLSEECLTYINKAYSKTIQIRNLSNELFEYFLINSEKSITLENAEEAQYILEDYLSEFCVLLKMNGYTISSDLLSWQPVKIKVSFDYLGRIIDNLVSNIKKYADMSFPIELSSTYKESFLGITIKNQKLQSDSCIQGTGIGVKNISSMMIQMGGYCYVDVAAKTYSISLYFPIS